MAVISAGGQVMDEGVREAGRAASCCTVCHSVAPSTSTQTSASASTSSPTVIWGLGGGGGLLPISFYNDRRHGEPSPGRRGDVRANIMRSSGGPRLHVAGRLAKTANASAGDRLCLCASRVSLLSAILRHHVHVRGIPLNPVTQKQLLSRA